MNKKYDSGDDYEETIDNKNREEIQQKEQKRKNSREDQEKEINSQNKKRKETRNITTRIQNI